MRGLSRLGAFHADVASEPHIQQCIGRRGIPAVKAQTVVCHMREKPFPQTREEQEYVEFGAPFLAQSLPRREVWSRERLRASSVLFRIGGKRLAIPRTTRLPSALTRSICSAAGRTGAI